MEGSPERISGHKMYGLILQNMAEYIQNKHGDNMWKKVGNKGSPPFRKVQFFLTLFKRPLPPPPFI